MPATIGPSTPAPLWHIPAFTILGGLAGGTIINGWTNVVVGAAKRNLSVACLGYGALQGAIGSLPLTALAIAGLEIPRALLAYTGPNRLTAALKKVDILARARDPLTYFVTNDALSSLFAGWVGSRVTPAGFTQDTELNTWLESMVVILGTAAVAVAAVEGTAYVQRRTATRAHAA